MVQEIKLNQIDAVVTTVGTPGTDDNIPTEKAVRDALIAAGIGGGGGGSDLLDIVTFTRVASAANGTVTYAHAAGVVPSYIIFQSAAGDDRNAGSDGYGNLTKNGCTYWSFNDGTDDGVSLSHSIVLRTQVGPEEKDSGAITAMTSTDFDITWTLTGTPTATTFTIVAYVYGPTGASSPYTTVTAKTAGVDYQAGPTGGLLVVSALQTVSGVGVRQIVSDVGPIPTTQVATFQLHEIGEGASMSAPILPNEYYKVNGAAETILFYE